MTGFDDFLRTLLFRKFCVGKVKFDFMEALLAVCTTGVGSLSNRIPGQWDA